MLRGTRSVGASLERARQSYVPPVSGRLLPTPHPSSGLRPCGRWPLPYAVLGGRRDTAIAVEPPARGVGGDRGAGRLWVVLSAGG